jgi:hypothetical protein
MVDVHRDMTTTYLYVHKKSVKNTREALTRILCFMIFNGGVGVVLFKHSLLSGLENVS